MQEPKAVEKRPEETEENSKEKPGGIDESFFFRFDLSTFFDKTKM